MPFPVPSCAGSVPVIVAPACSASALTLYLALANSLPQRKRKLHLMNICYELVHLIHILHTLLPFILMMALRSRWYYAQFSNEKIKAQRDAKLYVYH